MPGGSSTLDEESAMNRSLVSFRPCLCSLQTNPCNRLPRRGHRSLARPTDYYFVVAAVPVFARLGTHHVCIPELCPWIDLHAALFVTLPVTLDRANLPGHPRMHKNQPPSDQSRDLPSRWGRCASR